MQVGDYDFKHVANIEPARNENGSVKAFMPQGRYGKAGSVLLNKYGVGPFCKFKIPTSFRTSGVYVLTIEGEIRYVGECANLSARFNMGYGNISPKNCYKGGQET